MSDAAASPARKTVVVLGASTPHGAAVVRALARDGANLVLGGRSREKLEALEEEVRLLGGGAVVVGVHLAKRHHLVHLAQAAEEAFGGLDALIFMARACSPPLESLDVDAWERSVDVNLKGFLYALTAALPIIREGGGGDVIVLGLEDAAQDPVSQACRAGVRAVLEGLVRDHAFGGVRAAEITADSQRLEQTPDALPQTVLRALNEPRDANAGVVAAHRV